jgi:hypothetical protein
VRQDHFVCFHRSFAEVSYSALAPTITVDYNDCFYMLTNTKETNPGSVAKKKSAKKG